MVLLRHIGQEACCYCCFGLGCCRMAASVSVRQEVAVPVHHLDRPFVLVRLVGICFAY